VVAERFQHACARAILISSDGVLSTIKFNDEALINAAEINHIAVDWRLPPEFAAPESPVSKLEPEQAFSVRLLPP
jgi:hypothetical protein